MIKLMLSISAIDDQFSIITLLLNCIMKAKVDEFITQELQPNTYSITVFNIPIGMHLFINIAQTASILSSSVDCESDDPYDYKSLC